MICHVECDSGLMVVVAYWLLTVSLMNDITHLYQNKCDARASKGPKQAGPKLT